MLGFRDVLALWRTREEFAHFWNRSLGAIPFPAFFWELPPLTDDTLDRPFECVFIDSPELVPVEADAQAFDAKFENAASDARAIAFSNLGGDALLISPVPVNAETRYAHLAAFVRTTSDTQAAAFWSRVSLAIDTRIGAVPIWISTAGLGVDWLHVRIDSRPKYYRHQAYRKTDFWPPT